MQHNHPQDYEYPSQPVTECPFPFYEAVRDECPVYQLPGQQAFFVGKYTDVLDAARDTTSFSSLRAVVGAGDPEFEAILAQGFEQVPTLTNNDPPQHSRFRKLINRSFSLKAVEALTPRIRRICDDLIDGFIADGEVDFVSRFALPIPAIVIADFLGVSHDDIDDFTRWADDIQTLVTGFYDRDKGLECLRSLVAFQQYFAAEIEKRRAAPGDDLVSQLITARVDKERPLDVPEMLELCRVFLVGGNETTASFISNTMLLMLRHPEQFELVRNDHSLIPAFLEESLRVESPAQWLGRVVPEGGAQLHGVDMPAGSRVLLSWASANRDSERFENPDDFDFQLERPDHHVAFGYANHYCVGLHLARAEARVAFEAILTRMTNIRLDESAGPLEYGNSPVLRIPKRLPLLFDAVAVDTGTD